MGNRKAKFKDVRGKIGYCDKYDLPFAANTGHYVYIRKHNKTTDKCAVSTSTSLESKGKKIKKAHRLGELFLPLLISSTL
jgi:hypothetical protein